MSTRINEYSSEAWIAALKGLGEDSASLLGELEGYLGRILRKTLSSRKLNGEEIEDLKQEAMAQLLGSLHTFRGDSAFTTWAAAVATRVAYTELRRKASREAKHAAFEAAQRDSLEVLDHQGALEDQVAKHRLVAALHEAIDTELTDRQKIATLALLRGVPTIEIAEQLNSNQNAVYKLVHDARLRLKATLERRGVTAEMVDDVVAGGGQ